MAGNSAELPALTSRTLLTERPGHYIVQHYRDLPQRVRINEALLGAQRLTVADARYLEGLGRPIYVVVENQRDVQRNAVMQNRYGDSVYRNASIQLYQYRPASLEAR
jgi:hypothetical protein